MREWFIPVMWAEGLLWSERGYDSLPEMKHEVAQYERELVGYIRVSNSITWHVVASDFPCKLDWYFVIQYRDKIPHAEFNGSEDWFYNTYLDKDDESDHECLIVGAGGKHSAVVSTQGMWREAKADGAYEPYERHY